MSKPPADFATTVEAALMAMLKEKLEPADKIKCLAVSVRWAAVKARLVLPEHGAGFDDLPGDEEV